MSAATPVDSATPAHWRHAVPVEELERLLALSGVRGLLSVTVNWVVIAASFLAVALAPGPLALAIAIPLALVVIGGRQLGLAVLMHEAAHRILLRNRRWNDWVGNWLCAYPIWSDLHSYRAYHLQHHAKNWTDEDPDLGLATPFPITRASLRRKVWRDLSGQTGRKFARASFKRTFGRYRSGDATTRAAARGVLITNAVLLAALASLGAAWLYALWVGAWLLVYPLLTRIRSISEHAMVPDPADPLRNTRTTRVRWWERLFLAPNHVNYHLEHHLLMTVPHYRLAHLHRLLEAHGVLDRACVANGYREVLALAASKRHGPDPKPRIEPRIPPF